jgi:hypothetical protein
MKEKTGMRTCVPIEQIRAVISFESRQQKLGDAGLEEYISSANKTWRGD